MIGNEPVGDVHSGFILLLLSPSLRLLTSAVALVNPIFPPRFNLTSIKSAAVAAAQVKSHSADPYQFSVRLMTKRRDGDHRQRKARERACEASAIFVDGLSINSDLLPPSLFLSLSFSLFLSHPFFHASAFEGERALRDLHEKTTFCRDAQAAASFYRPGS